MDLKMSGGYRPVIYVSTGPVTATFTLGLLRQK